MAGKTAKRDTTTTVDRAADRPQIAEAFDGDVAVMVREEGGVRRALFAPAGVRKLGDEGFDLMYEMQSCVRRIGEAFDDLGEAVDQARKAGMSWAAIGFCTGYSAQGAQNRWGGEDREAGWDE